MKEDHGNVRMSPARQNALAGSGFVISPGLGINDFAEALKRSFNETLCTGGGSNKKKIKLKEGLGKIRDLFRCAHAKGNKVIFIGNGGSAAIASHMATDYTKNGGIRSIAFNDAATLTCMANDFGYFQVFAKQLEYYAREDDVVVCISSSGKSRNILEAAAECMTREIKLVTLTGFEPENPLRGVGDFNFYVPAGDYGLIEIAHLTLLHSITSLSQF